MIKKRFLSMLVLLMVAVTGAWAKNYYNVTFSGFSTSALNTTVTTTLPQTFTGADIFSFNPWHIVGQDGNEFTSVTVTNNGSGMVSASMINWGAMSITVSGAFDGNATIHVDIACGEDVENGYNTSADITVRCVFAYEAFDVTYDANGGSGAPSAQLKRKDTDLTLSTAVPTRTGYTFAGWNTAADGSGTSYAAGATYTADADVTLYAQWTVNVTGVTLNESTASLAVGDKVALNATVLPAGATDKTVKWTVSGTDAGAVKLYTDEACNTEAGTAATSALTVYALGMSVGEATVKVESNADATKTATCTVTVTPAVYSIALKDGTDDAASWQGKAGEGNYQALPLEGLEAGTAVTVKYSGTKEVKSIKAVKKKAPATDLSMVDCAGTARTDGQWTANCYMVHTAGDYKLPLVYGNAIKAGETNAAAYTGVENQNTTLTFPRHDGNAITAPWIKDNGITVTQAELLWEDADGLITEVGISGDYLTLTVGKDAATQEGNALVAAKDGEGNVVWSWHIWVTKQTFAAADLTTVATGSHDYKVTPVNLGWVGDTKSQGTNTFYQWGRKDPFQGTGTVTFDGSTTATIADNIKNPMTFYNVDNKPSNTTYRNMWDAQQTGTDDIATATVKTVYDPSPAGFCVPTGNLYYYMKNGSGVSFGWDGENKGRNLTSVTPNVFFPASGSRFYSSGSLSLVGGDGYCWSASAHGFSTSNGRDLYFGSSYLYWTSAYRSAGAPVRAVAEEEPSF